MPDHVPLPTIDDLRAQLYCDLYIQAVEALRPHTVKQLPLRIINSSIDAAYQHLQSIVDGSPGAHLSAALHQLWSQSTALVTQLLPRFRPAFSANHSDSAFRLQNILRHSLWRIPYKHSSPGTPRNPWCRSMMVF